MTVRTLGLIPARGGSKGVPRKNLSLLGGKPLLAYTVESARAASRLTRLVLSTEDPEIAEVGRQLGVEVPFLRSRSLAEDTTPMLPVVQDAVKRLEEAGESYEAVCLLQPTCPLRRAGEIDACIELLERSGADAVVTVLPVPAEYNPYWVYLMGEGGQLRLALSASQPVPRRQDLPPAYHREGSVYVVRRRVVMEENSLYGHQLVGYPVDPVRRVNIDTADDLRRAEQLISERV
jgi:CMP-N-acetylneuraminic acid synthetase